MTRIHIRRIFYIIFINIVFISCTNDKRTGGGDMDSSAIKSSEVLLSEGELIMLKKAAEYLIHNRLDPLKGTINSFVFCDRFDFFSMRRFDNDAQKEANLSENIGLEINNKYGGKRCEGINRFSSNKHGSKLLTFSAFSSEYVIISYQEIEPNLTEDVCSRDYNYIGVGTNLSTEI